MASDNILAPHIVLLGEALQPVLRRVEAELSKPAHPTGKSFIAVAEHSLGYLGDAVERLSAEMNRVLNSVVEAADVPDAQVHRAVGRYEVILDGLLERYAELRQARPRLAHRRGHELLVTVFRHTLTQIQDWLRDVVDTATDPMQVLKRKGLPTSGNVSLELAIHFTTPKELEKFTDWVAEQEEAEDRKSSFWNGLAAVAFGIFLGGLFFGDDD